MAKRRVKLPWCIEVEYHGKPSEFFSIVRMVGDVKDLHLETVDGHKVSIDRRKIAKVMMINAKPRPKPKESDDAET